MPLPIVREDTRERVRQEIISTEDWPRKQLLALKRTNPLLAEFVALSVEGSADKIATVSATLTLHRLLELESERHMN